MRGAGVRRVLQIYAVGVTTALGSSAAPPVACAATDRETSNAFADDTRVALPARPSLDYSVLSRELNGRAFTVAGDRVFFAGDGFVSEYNPATGAVIPVARWTPPSGSFVGALDVDSAGNLVIAGHASGTTLDLVSAGTTSEGSPMRPSISTPRVARSCMRSAPRARSCMESATRSAAWCGWAR